MLVKGGTDGNVDFSSVWYPDINLSAILQGMLEISILDMILKIIKLKLQPHLPGANAFKTSQ